MNFRTSSQKEVRIELTPLIDIIFQLVLFFMVSTTFEQSPVIDIELPEASTDQMVSQDVSMEIWIDEDGAIFVDQKKSLPDEMERQVREKLRENPNMLIIVNADQTVEHRSVVEVIDQLQEFGVQQLSIGTAKKR